MAQLQRSIQENLLILLTYSTEHFKMIRNLVPVATFGGMYRQAVAEIYNYIDDYDTPPTDHLPDLFEKELTNKDPKVVTAYEQLILNIREGKDTVNPRFVIDKLQSFLSIQALTAGIIDASEKLQQETDDAVEVAESILSNALSRRIQVFNPGIFFGDTGKSLNFLTVDPATQTFSTGIKELDQRHLGPTRQELHLLMGLTNRGKSWWLIQLGKYAMLHRLKVCHITLEMKEDLVAQRYVQAMFAVGKEKVPQKIMRFVKNNDDRLSSIYEDEMLPKISLKDTNAHAELKKKMEPWAPKLNNLVIKQFPTRQLTFSTLRGYLDLLESSHRFVPDILLLDYADIMQVDPKDYRLGTRSNYEHLRGLAGERDMAINTVTQANREGARSGDLKETHVGEDYSKLQTADVGIFYNQTKEEAKYGFARLYVGKARNDIAREMIFISQGYGIGQFCCDSVAYKESYKEVVKQHSDGKEQ